ncbi:MAG: flagellar basal-body rod protein FlgG [Planctomycetota bacterium]|jgi:flagellar basal-body rod protein FlgG
MLKAFSTAATGMSSQQTMIDSIAHNLANINTNGYKRAQINFQDLLYIKLREAGREIASGVISPSGLEIGSGVRMASTNKVYTIGELQTTGRDLDLAIQGDGFLEVTLASGDKRYTRDGSLSMDANGQLVNSSGYVVSPGITIPSNSTTIDVGSDGTVSVMTPSGSTTVGTMQLYRFANPAGLSAEGDNLLRETEASGTVTSGTAGEDGFGTILSKTLEKSNVEMVTELVNLISAQRGYEINSRVIRAGDNILRNLNMLIR